MNQYVNTDSLKSDLREIFTDVLEGVQDDPYFVFTIWSDDEIVEGYVDYHAQRINEDMGRYLHMKDTRIVGNFNNIQHDYEGDFADMVRRLDSGADDEQTNADRDFLTAWFWETFGTFGLKYNFSNEVFESLYCAEHEEKAVAV